VTRIVYVSSEVHPFSKTGGLADVAHALPDALGRAGVDVTVFSPCYRSVKQWLAAHGALTRDVALPDEVWSGAERHRASYRILEQRAQRLVFVVNDALFDRPQLYVDADGRDYADSVVRFAFFCRAVLEYGLFTGEIPDLVHLNDWQTALIGVYLKTIYRQPALQRVRSVLTVHNLGYQGHFPAEQLLATGLGWEVFHAEGLEFYGGLNLLKGGLVFADALTTVSPTYAEEMQTAEAGRGLDGVVRAQRQKLVGILNGINVREWNPADDPHLPAHYDSSNLGGKAACKRALQQRAGLPARDTSFVLGVISRFDAQKGIPLIADAIETLADLDLQLVVLGAGDRAIENRMRALMAAHPDRVHVHADFDEPFAHLIEAGADAFLMPSAYEPCGLNQMYSHRYGTVPVVRETGGLKDTVRDFSSAALAAGQASGFTFRDLDAKQLAAAIRRAETLYRSDSESWRALMRHIMGIDHSWEESARAYRELYERVSNTRGT
jgi:starch synthase